MTLDKLTQDQVLLRRRQWFQSVLWSIQNQKIRIDSNPFLAASTFIGKNVTYEIWIEIQAKVYNHTSVNQEIVDLNLKRLSASSVFMEIIEFKCQNISNVFEKVNNLLYKYEQVLKLYPTIKAMETGHPEVQTEKVVKRLNALIEFQKNWDYAQQVVARIEFLKSVGPPFYCPLGTAQDNSLFFSRFATDEELQMIFR